MDTKPMTLYTMDDCRWCDMLKKRLKHEGIDYIENKNMTEIMAKDFKTVPQLEIGPGEYLDFEGAIKWVNNRV